jgi:hypothetical protein
MIQTVGIALGRLFTILFVLMGIILALNTFTYLNFDPSYGFLKLKQEAIATGIYLPFYYCHVFAGGLILLAGFVQFSKNLRQRHTRLIGLRATFTSWEFCFLLRPAA